MSCEKNCRKELSRRKNVDRQMTILGAEVNSVRCSTLSIYRNYT